MVKSLIPLLAALLRSAEVNHAAIHTARAQFSRTKTAVASS